MTLLREDIEMRTIPRLWNRIETGAIAGSDLIAIGVSILLMCLLTILFSGCDNVAQLKAKDAQTTPVTTAAMERSAFTSAVPATP